MKRDFQRHCWLNEISKQCLKEREKTAKVATFALQREGYYNGY